MSFKGHTKWNILAGDVLEATEISKTESCPNQFRYKTHTIGSHDRTIVGFKITGHRNDPYNGSFRIHQGNILDSEMKVELCSGSWAVMNWSITTWSVDKLLYGKEISWGGTRFVRSFSYDSLALQQPSGRSGILQQNGPAGFVDTLILCLIQAQDAFWNEAHSISRVFRINHVRLEKNE